MPKIFLRKIFSKTINHFKKTGKCHCELAILYETHQYRWFLKEHDLKTHRLKYVPDLL